MASIKIKFLGSCIVEPFEQVIKDNLHKRTKIDSEIHFGDFGALDAEVFDLTSSLYVNQPHFIVLNPLDEIFVSGPLTEAICNKKIQNLNAAITFLKSNSNCNIIVTTLAVPSLRTLGSIDIYLENSHDKLVQVFNNNVREICKLEGIQVLDLEYIAFEHGRVNWFDRRMWHLAKLPFSNASSEYFADQLAALVCAKLGRNKKCLVLDLDNTLWGGVIGDDGIGGIDVGQGSPVGEAFLAFQKYLKSLKERGVMLAICSKNELDNALLPFRHHTEMVLKEHDFVSIKANWFPKSQNIAEIARELNIGTDSLVFFDDNPVERGEVSSAIPEVIVVDVSNDPSDYIDTLIAGNFFELLTVTNEDRQRTQSMLANKHRDNAKSKYQNLNEYLASLNMKASYRAPELHQILRFEQLIAKTNQFNVSQKKYSNIQISEMLKESKAYVRAVCLEDSYGDLGLISAIVGRVEGSSLIIDNWVMSCRVFNRTLEEGIISQMRADAEKLNLSTIEVELRQTSKNKPIHQLFKRLHFEQLDDNNFRLDVRTDKKYQTPIEWKP